MALPKSTVTLATILAILIAVAAILGYKYWYKPLDLGTQVGSERQVKVTPPTTTLASPSPQASPSPKPLKQGIETYNISQPGNLLGPKITKLTLNPHDPKVNQSQTITVTFASPDTVTGAKVNFVSDNNSIFLPLTLNNQVWSVTHTVSDTVLYRYLVSISANDQSGNSQVDVTMR